MHFAGRESNHYVCAKMLSAEKPQRFASSSGTTPLMLTRNVLCVHVYACRVLYVLTLIHNMNYQKNMYLM